MRPPIVESILEQVRSDGDAALMALTEQFDGFRPDPLQVSTELSQAWDQTPANLRDALELAAPPHPGLSPTPETPGSRRGGFTENSSVAAGGRYRQQACTSLVGGRPIPALC